MQPENQLMNGEMKDTARVMLTNLMERFKKIETIFPAVVKMQKQLEEVNADLIKFRKAKQNFVSPRENEAFKLAIETDVLAALDQQSRDISHIHAAGISKIEARLVNIEKLSSEIVPYKTFSVTAPC